jgi:hypothetical protein
MLLAETRFEEWSGIDTDAFRRAEVYWTDTPCPYQDGWAVVHEGRCYYGLMWGCDEMYVALNMNDPDHTCPTALMHEFGHCLLMEAGLDPDADHSNDAFWSFMAQVRQETCNRGW